MVIFFLSKKSLKTKDGNNSKRLVEGHPFTEAEVLYVVRREYACTTLDVLARRFGLTFMDVNGKIQRYYRY